LTIDRAFKTASFAAFAQSTPVRRVLLFGGDAPMLRTGLSGIRRIVGKYRSWDANKRDKNQE